MRKLFAALAAVCFFATASSAADIVRERKTVVIIRGLAGEILSPMTDFADKVHAKGYRVRLASIYFESASDADILIVHSMACFNGLNSRAKLIITIDCPIWAHMVLPRAPRGSRVTNFYTFGHPRIAGAVNVRISGGHVAAPTTAQRRILSLL